MDAVELEMIAALKEKPNRHLSFFKGILPSLEDFDELETLDFQMEVLKVIKKVRERKHPLPWRSKTPYDSPSSTPSMPSPSSTPSMPSPSSTLSMPSPSSTPPLVRNQYIQRQQNSQHNVLAYQNQIEPNMSTLQFYEGGHNLGLDYLHNASSNDSTDCSFQNL